MKHRFNQEWLTKKFRKSSRERTARSNNYPMTS